MSSANPYLRSRPPLRAGPLERPIAGGLKLDAEHVGAIDASHQRCVALGLARIERPELGLISQSELACARERNRRLQRHASPVMELLCGQVAVSHNMVVLTDATGTVLHAIGDNEFLDRASKVALMPGAVWSEASKGTNGIGTALMDERPTFVHADEHFLHANHFLTCSAAPILDPRGNVLGVLDISGDQRSYHPHTMALVKMSARMIENQWLIDECRGALRLMLHRRADHLGTLAGGMLAVDGDGRIVGANRGALEQLGLSGAALRMQTLQSLFGLSVGALIERFRSPQAPPRAVRVGERALVLQAQLEAPVASAARLAPPRPVAERHAVSTRATMPRPASAAAAHGSAHAPQDAAVALALERLVRGLEHGLPVVLQGEAGSGRQWLARAAHDAVRPGHGFHVLAGRSAGPAEVDAAWSSLPGEQLLPTVFVAEPGELGQAAQAHLLHWLESRDVLVRGGALICATREPLRALVEARRLREELVQRLNGLTLRLPPLRERSDRLALARSMVAPLHTLSTEVCRLIEHHRWPGNLRQLAQAMRAAVAMAGNAATIERHHLNDDLLDAPAAVPAAALAGAPSQALEEIELALIRQSVEALGGNISLAARRLGISRNTIYRKLRWNNRQPR